MSLLSGAGAYAVAAALFAVDASMAEPVPVSPVAHG